LGIWTFGDFGAASKTCLSATSCLKNKHLHIWASGHLAIFEFTSKTCIGTKCPRGQLPAAIASRQPAIAAHHRKASCSFVGHARDSTNKPSVS
jgi:hypothetical protein